MTDEQLLAIMIRADTSTQRIPPSIRMIAHAIAAAERERCAMLRAMARQVVEADDAQELTQQHIELLRAALEENRPPTSLDGGDKS
jgi:hypothetical protein